MAAQTDVQFFSHLNTLAPQLTNDWGCMINLLDACLVNGVTLPVITSASVTTSGNITVNFNTPHTCLIFQCVTLTGFMPATLNGKYRIIGVPSTTQLTLSSDLSAQSATTMGTAKLSPLGYEIVFSAAQKRVYRALNPTTNHPYIRVDESRSNTDGTSIYNDTYAKSAMVGLLESMNSIDDVNSNDVLQLPFYPSDPDKNWTITGTNGNCIRGWAKWYWAVSDWYSFSEGTSTQNGQRSYTLIGNSEAFYLTNSLAGTSDLFSTNYGCGLFDSALKSDVIPNWFLMAQDYQIPVGNVSYGNSKGATSYYSNTFDGNKYFTPKYDIASKYSESSNTFIIAPSLSGYDVSSFNASNTPCVNNIIRDERNFLRGNLKHLMWAGKNYNNGSAALPILSDTSMYIWTAGIVQWYVMGGVYFYLGEIL